MSELAIALSIIGTILSIIVASIIVWKCLKKANIKALEDYSANKEGTCVLHGKELTELKTTSRLMIESQDVTLQALDKIGKGESPNGEITNQRRKLKEHMLNQFGPDK